MNKLVEEAREELQADRAYIFLKQYGKWLITGAVLLIAATAIHNWYRHSVETQSANTGALYDQILQQFSAGKYPQDALAEMHESGVGEYVFFAQSREAQHLIDNHDYDGAIAILQAIALDENAATASQDLALLHIVQLWMEHDLLDEKIDGYLNRLTQAGRPWRLAALELQALHYMMNSQWDDARNLLISLNDETTISSAMKQRVATLLDVIQHPNRDHYLSLSSSSN